VLARLHKTKMPFRQENVFVARQCADDANAKLGDCIGHQRPMPLAAHAVENDARDAHGGIVRGESPHHSRGRLGLSGNIEDQHDGEPKARGEVGGGIAQLSRLKA